MHIWSWHKAVFSFLTTQLHEHYIVVFLRGLTLAQSGYAFQILLVTMICTLCP